MGAIVVDTPSVQRASPSTPSSAPTGTAEQPAAGTVWHTLPFDEAVHTLESDLRQGLSEAEASARLEKYGPNALVEKPLKSPWAILWEQITSPLVLLLIGAAVISALLGKADSVIAITAIVILNAVLGVVQEYRAERAMEALQRMATPAVRVRREGRVRDIVSRELVPGDIIVLEAGSIVPADGRLVESNNVRVQEASLTGESQPVDKVTDPLTDANAPLGDRSNMVFMGTSVAHGRGAAVVTATGMATELGRIADMIQSVESEKTPLQRRIDEVGNVLIRGALVVMGIAFVIGLLVGDPFEEVLLNAVAIAVAVVPEGLPAVVTVALALGAQRMLRRRALIRKLPAVETLGSVTTIASDKTGTLTQNRMTVTTVDTSGYTSTVDQAAEAGMAVLLPANGTGRKTDAAQIALAFMGGALCNDATLEVRDGQTVVVGDPTEGALIVAARRFGIDTEALNAALPRVAEAPFESDRKRMTTVHQVLPTGGDLTRYLRDLLGADTPYIEFTKGAVDSLLTVCTHVWDHGEAIPLDEAGKARIADADNQFAQDGLRVLGIAYRALTEVGPRETYQTLEHDLIFIGMVGIIDPPRREVKDAVQVAVTAGIRPMMITGDHPLTALAIARELGIARPDDRVITGHELAKMSQQELENTVEHVAVFARVSPEHKLNIVQALQARGHVTAMTGDGVNDAPALKRANIGVAMGITGTPVSKEASDMVILDDNFATIVSAVEEGRTIYDNVRRFIKYLLASNTGELIVLLITQLIAGMTLPLTTLQILWMNLITDGIPALALGVEKPEPGAMKRPPYAPNESMFGRGLGRHIVLVGALLGITGLALGYWAFSNDLRAANGAPAWNTMVFIFLTIAQMGHAYGLRSHRETVFRLPFFGNPLLLIAIVATVILQLLAIYLPFFNTIFNTAPLTVEQLLICLALSTIVFWGVELEKLLIRRGVLK
jgi:Ca2+-transporting ATPase